MPVHKPNSEYDVLLPLWNRCRDVIEGEDTVKAKGDVYLPRLDNQDANQYAAYKLRAMFYGASGRTVEGLTGSIFRKPPKITFPESHRGWLDEVSEDTLGLEVFSKKVLRNVISVGRHGVLLDLPEEEQVQPTPYFGSYTAEDIINWRQDLIGGRKTLTLVVLREHYKEVDESDAFTVKDKTRYRVLRLVDAAEALAIVAVFKSSDGEFDNDKQDEIEKLRFVSNSSSKKVYIQQVYEKFETPNKTNNEDYILTSAHIPKLHGKTIDYIPFVFFGTVSLTPDAENPPILSIVNVNISHYRNSADLEHGRHYTALPTAWAAGFTTQSGTKLLIGSTAAWVSEEPNAKVGYLEFTGEGLGHLQAGMEQKEGLMAILGARMLEEPRASVEAADTHRIRRSGEESTVASIAGTIEAGVTTLLKWAAEWLGLNSDEASVEFNKDFTTKPMDPRMLNGLISLLQQGRISYDTFFYNLERGELIPDGRTVEDELDLIETNPALPVTKEPIKLEAEPFTDDNFDDDDDDEENEDKDEKAA